MVVEEGEWRTAGRRTSPLVQNWGEKMFREGPQGTRSACYPVSEVQQVLKEAAACGWKESPAPCPSTQMYTGLRYTSENS